MKTCTICKENKNSNDFYKNKITKDGLGSQCKLCGLKEKQRICNNKKRHLVDLLGGKCELCGYNKNIKALEFHHKDDNKEFDISLKLRINIEDLILEAKKCMLVCANCHREIYYPNE